MPKKTSLCRKFTLRGTRINQITTYSESLNPMNSLFQQTESDNATGAFPASGANGIAQLSRDSADGLHLENPTTQETYLPIALPVCELMTITPELAQEWLSVNTHNRNLRSLLASAYARDIENNKWPITGATISFDVEGKLLDGQHRLTAIISAGKTIQSFVVRNLPLSARAVTDTGQSRTAADALRLENYNNSKQLPPVIRNLLQIKAGRIGIGRITHSEIFALAIKHVAIGNSITYCAASQVVSPSVLAAIHYAAVISDYGDKADEFATLLIEGLCTEKTNPAFRWREYLNAQRKQRQVLVNMQMLGTCLAWHSFVAGKTKAFVKTPSKFYNDTFDLDKI